KAFIPSLLGIVRTGCWNFALQRGRYMVTRKIKPFEVEGFRIEHGGHMVGLWAFYIQGTLFKKWPALMPENPVIIDIGANCGVVGWCCRKRFPKATIIAIEPHPTLAEECRGLVCNGITVYNQVYNVALSDEPGN